MPNLTYEDAVRFVNDAVVEKGYDYVYEMVVSNEFPACVNAVKDDDGTIYPSCIVGNALHRAGASLEDLLDNNTAAVGDLLGALDYDVDSKTLLFLMDVQDSQDNDVPWGVAVVKATEYANKERFTVDHTGEEE